MPRANRQYARDRDFWRLCLYEACRRYGLRVLNYIVTCNHVHIMVDSNDADTVPRAMQYLSGRTAQNYNRRKARHGAFWEDRYHAVPIKSRSHFLECLVYVDLNMVPAGVVAHPCMWPWAGYNEIQNPRDRYRIIDLDCLLALSEVSSLPEFQASHRSWVADKLSCGSSSRDPRWTTNPAMGVP